MPGPSLYEISAGISAILENSDVHGGLSDEEIAELDQLEGDFRQKATSICRLLAELVALERAAALEHERLKELLHTRVRRVASLKSYLQSRMEVIGLQKLDLDGFEIRLQKSPLSVEFKGDPHALPQEYVTMRVEISKSALLAAYRHGEPMPAGVEVVAKTHLRIK